MDEHDDPPTLLAGRYQLAERIGHGHTGVVHRSFDRELETWVAVKLLDPKRITSERASAGLRRAIRLARRITHPCVTRIYEFGRDGDRQFLTMELIPGESLHARLTRLHRLPPEQVPGLALSLAKALAAVHAADAVHGDIKPRNVLLSPDRDAVLSDCGIARGIADPTREFADFTHDALRYAAPELLLGASATPRSDVYALAALLFVAITGASPWPDDDPHQLLASKRLPHDPALRIHSPALVGGWLELLAECLRHDPTARPHDAQAVLARVVALYRGTGHVPMSFTADGEAPLAPLAVLPPARWVVVPRFTTDDPALRRDSAWITSDLVQALRHVRSLRVVSDAPAATTPGPIVQVLGTLQPDPDGLLISVRILPDIDASPCADFVLQRSRGQLPSLGSDLAARILAALGSPERHQQATRPELLHADAVEHYIMARTAMHAMRTADAVAHYEAALALAPRHRALRLGYVMARVRHAILFRSPTPTELSELRALIEATIAEYSDSGEACMAMASLMFAVGEPIACIRWACIGMARAPRLRALGLIGCALMAIGRLSDAERRFIVSTASDDDSALLCLCRAELAAYQDRWDDYLTLFNGPLARMRMRGVYVAHMLLWRGDHATIARLAADVADNRDCHPPEALRDLKALVGFLQDRGDRRQILDDLAPIHLTAPNSYHTRRMLMILCEMACILGDLPRARELLLRADDHSLIEWQWITQCINLAPLRDDPHYRAVCERVRARADQIAETIWG